MSDLKYIPVTKYKSERDYPFYANVIHDDGRNERLKVEGRGQQIPPTVVALAIEKVAPADILLSDYMQDRAHDGTYYGERGRDIARTVIEWMLSKNPSATSGDWLDARMDEIEKGRTMPYNWRKDVRNWFEDSDKYPEVPFDIQNRVLAVRPSGGGKVVALPTGHTIAYTYAKAMYNILCDNESYYANYSKYEDKVSVREYHGNKRWGHNTTRRWAMRNGVLILGCQRIPISAIEDLASREGWAGKIKNKYR